MNQIPKKNTIKPKKMPKRYRWWVPPVAFLSMLPVVAASIFIIYDFLHSQIERGQFNVSDTFITENLAHSLDLKLAAKASYPSKALNIDRDLGVVDGLRNQVFRYQVLDDNLTEYGLMVSPQAPPPSTGYRVVILLHGYINPTRYKTEVDYLSEAEAYAKQGFLVVKPDLRGQGESIDSGFADSAYYSMSYNTDVLSLVSALRQTSYVDKSQINLWGHSMGAYIALRAAVLSKYIKSTAILSGPIDSLQEMYLTYIPPSDENNPYALATRNDVFAKYGTPADNKSFWYDASPINFLSNIKGTVQIYVGLEDVVVPPRFSADLNKALTRVRVKHQYFAYPSGGHSLEAQRSEIYSQTARLFNSN